MKTVIHSQNAPAPIGPYSQAVKVGSMLYLSGQIALDPYTGLMLQDSIEQETTQVMANIKAILSAAGIDFSAVVKTSIFLSDMNLFGAVNAVYEQYFKTDFPARETVQVAGLPKNANVEISVIAFINQQ
ncbi:MAG: RidA family protein [Bacteroidia bacterium]|jgi:2-iminobutanoate/2-iminopropanoate deaminase